MSRQAREPPRFFDLILNALLFSVSQMNLMMASRPVISEGSIPTSPHFVRGALSDYFQCTPKNSLYLRFATAVPMSLLALYCNLIKIKVKLRFQFPWLLLSVQILAHLW